MNIAKYDFKKIALIADVVIIICVIISVLITPDVNENNTTLVRGHYADIEKQVVKGDVSYDLYIKENKDSYKISADNSNCLILDDFRNSVKEGDPIQIYLNKPNPFFSIRSPVIVAIRKINNEYLSFNCVNNDSKKDKIQLPFFLIFIGTAVAGLIYKKEIKLLVK
jgi:hypothetical protein